MLPPYTTRPAGGSESATPLDPYTRCAGKPETANTPHQEVFPHCTRPVQDGAVPRIILGDDVAQRGSGDRTRMK